MKAVLVSICSVLSLFLVLSTSSYAAESANNSSASQSDDQEDDFNLEVQRILALCAGQTKLCLDNDVNLAAFAEAFSANDTVRELTIGAPGAVTELKIIDEDSKNLLAKGIAQHPSLKLLCINGICLDKSGVDFIVKALENNSDINTIRFTGGALDDNGLAEIPTLLQNNPSITRLNFSNNASITPLSLNDFAEKLGECPTLRFLDLSKCEQIKPNMGVGTAFKNSLMLNGEQNKCGLCRLTLNFKLNRELAKTLNERFASYKESMAMVMISKALFLLYPYYSPETDTYEGCNFADVPREVLELIAILMMELISP